MKKLGFMKGKKFVTCAKKEFCIDDNKKIKFKLYHKVRHHCHCTGKFKGAARSIWNLKY